MEIRVNERLDQGYTREEIRKLTGVAESTQQKNPSLLSAYGWGLQKADQLQLPTHLYFCGSVIVSP